MLRCVVSALAVLLLLSSNAFASAARSEEVLAQSFPAPPVLARSAIVLDVPSGNVLAAVNAHMRLPMASTTKIMTAVLALQQGQLTDRITVPRAAFDYEWDATTMGLHAGQTVTLRDLLYGLMLPSGADAANTIAIHYGGSEAAFVGQMNREASLLGLRDTHFSNAHGLTARNHFSSAYDLAALAQYASHFPDLMKIAGTRAYNWNGHVLVNLNHVIFWYSGADGIKPGYTGEAGICQVLDARRGGRHIVAVALNTPNLVTDARNLLNFGLRDFTWQQSSLPGDGPSVVQRGFDGYGRYIYYPGSGHYVRGKLLDAYAADGGLQALGFPRTEPLKEGKSQVQFFQNGALSFDSVSGRVTRLALGLTPLPQPATPTRTATPMPDVTAITSTVVPMPKEGTVSPRYAGHDTRSAAARPTSTVTPAVPKPTAPVQLMVAPAFGLFHGAHSGLLGRPVEAARIVHGYLVQVFAYGALVRNTKGGTVLLLPLGDRVLRARNFLPPHAGDRYPLAFASSPVLKSIGWLPKP
ncbi:MAG: hypothetical protein NVS2B16_13730 [Chloroflexota bacterium]